MQGTFLASRENFLEGNVNVEGREKPVRYIIANKRNVNIVDLKKKIIECLFGK